MNKLVFTALQWLFSDDANIDENLLNELRAINTGKVKTDDKLVLAAIGIMTGKVDPECGTYSLYYSRELFLNLGFDKEKNRKTVLKLLKEDKLDVVYVPEYEFDNHIGLKLKYKDETENED